MPVAETQLIPLQELASGEAGTIRNQVIKNLVALAASELKRLPDQLVVRDIRPATDLDFATEDWFEVTGATAAAYETMCTGTLSTDRYIAFYGAKDDGMQSCTLLRFDIGGGIKVIWNLQSLSLSMDDERVGYSPSGVIIKPSTIYTISRYVQFASSPSHIVLKGVVVEPRGRVISP